MIPPKTLKPVLLCALLLATLLAYAQPIRPAEAVFDSLVRQVPRMGTPAERLPVYLALAEACNDMQSPHARYYARLAIAYGQRFGDGKAAFEGYDQLGRHFRLIEQYDRQHTVEEKKLALATTLAGPAMILDALNDLGLNAAYRQNLDSARFYFDQAGQYIGQVVDQEPLGNYYTCMGILANLEGDVNAALENYLKAIAIYGLSENKILMTLYNNIGYIYSGSGRYELAVQNFKKCFDIADRLSHMKYMVTSLVNIGGTYHIMGDLGQAHQFLVKSLAYAEKLGNNRLTGNVYTTLAMVCLDRGEDRLAIHYCRQSLALLHDTQDAGIYVSSATNLARLLLEKSQVGEARELLSEVLPMARAGVLRKEEAEIYHTLFRADSLQGHHAQAIARYQAYTAITKQLAAQHNSEEIQEMQTRYEVLEKEKEIEKLDMDNKASALKIANQRYENYGLWGILSLALAAVAFTAYQYRGKQRLNEALRAKHGEIRQKNQTLSQKSHDLEKALAEREVLLKEIHHRVKNNLQLVASMMRLQARNQGHGSLENFIEKSQNRIASMALVHQTLYSSEKLETIDFQRYLDNLMAAIYQSFDFHHKTIQYHTDAQGCFFGLDTAIPLGIIINEIVYNAFKHAFLAQNTGQVSVRLCRKGHGQGLLAIQDDGAGMSANRSDQPGESYGLTLVRLLVKQLGGRMAIENGQGTKITIHFNLTNEQP